MTGPAVYRTKTGMSAVEQAIHVFAILCTCGMWYPIYRMRKHAVNRTSTTYIAR